MKFKCVRAQINLRSLFSLISVSLLISLGGCSVSFVENPNKFPIGTTSADRPDYNHYAQPDPIIHKLPTQLGAEVAEFLDSIFDLKSIPDMACSGGQVYQKFVDKYFVSPQGVAPKIRFICLSRLTDQEQVLEWILDEAPEAVWTLIPPQELFNFDFSSIKSLQVSAHSTLKITVSRGKVSLVWNGVKVRLKAKALAGSSLSWIPESLLFFNLYGVEATNDGKYAVKLILPFGIPYSYSGDFQIISQKNQTLYFVSPQVQTGGN
jgi:hypothetical protein